MNSDYYYPPWLLTDNDECSSQSCKYNSTCEDLVDDYLCYCVAGYTGKNCETGTHVLPVIMLYDGDYLISTIYYY